MASTNVSSLPSTLAILQDKLNIGFTLVDLIFGVTGTFLNIFLFSTKQFRAISCCTYFFGSAVTMFLQLTFSSVTATYAIYYPHPISYISVYCKLWLYLHPSISMMFRWMLAAACLDRYALSSTNARIRRFASVSVARYVVGAIVVLWIILPCHALVFVDIKGGNCIIVYGYAAALYNGIFTIINVYVIPISVMLFGTILIRRNLANKRERQQNVGQQQKSNEKERAQRKRDQQALVMLFAQVFIYSILTTPWVIYSVYSAIALNIQNKSVDRVAIEKFLSYLVGQVILLFPAASFYLYTLTSKMFRKELCIIIHSIVCCKWGINNGRIEPTMNEMSMRTRAAQ